MGEQSAMKVHQEWIESSGGWWLEGRRCADPSRLNRRRRPVVIIPGYGMNSHVLRHHPSGPSLVEVLCGGGREVWTADLRGQGGSKKERGRGRFGLAELALEDLPRVVEAALSRTETEASAVDVIGCSLGATVAYIYLGHHRQPGDHRVGAVVNIGGPLTWTRTHPLVRLAAQCPRLVGQVPIRGVRPLAAMMMPLIKRQPWLLSPYMNPSIIDLSKADEFLATIDDPNPGLSQEVARWIKERQLVVRGVRIEEALQEVDVPIQCVIAGQDGIVTPDAALSVLDAIGSREVEVLEVGSREVPYAHADLFISRGCDEVVFEPVRSWLDGISDEEKGDA